MVDKPPIPDGIDQEDLAQPTSFDTNKYAPKEKIGKATIGVNPNKVTRVGLGGLTTENY